MQFAHLATRLFNTPIAIHPRKAEIAMAGLAERLGITSIIGTDGRSIKPGAWFDDDDDFTSAKPTRSDPGYDVFNGVAVLPVTGTLVHKLGSVRPYSGMTGYDGIRQAWLTAQDDPEVKAIAEVYDSGGGEVAGCADLFETKLAMRGNKPCWAILQESAYSAAYWLASAADRIVVPRTGGTGSIGIICMHVDMSDALSKAGLKVTFITSAGADRKTDGHSEIPLSADALSAIQVEIDAMGDIFHDSVARGRGLSADAVRDMKAGTFMGQPSNGQPSAIDVGLADAVMSPEQAFAALLAEVA
ncbi:S49 family peptidase [Sphingomonas sp. CARO-RG-8B-R24-01]|uniref:S49 family peptidase n=1 Tax=Sphingomonas sp. CARO-RG-8B-R24-01 TaxID=2914831 RepID=UPI001F5679A9|nr:S49 family peptidase [Sphingomonas sp. CARO-RG-8B-R24-01]